MARPAGACKAPAVAMPRYGRAPALACMGPSAAEIKMRGRSERIRYLLKKVYTYFINGRQGAMTEAETIADRIWDIGAYMAELEEAINGRS